MSPPRPVLRDAPTSVPARRPRGRAVDLALLVLLTAFVTLRLLLGGGAGEWVVIGVVALALFLRPRRGSGPGGATDAAAPATDRASRRTPGPGRTT